MMEKYQDGFQMQKLLNQQKLAQLQHQRNVCEILFTTVSSAEKVALGLSQNKEYQLYDPYNSASYKNPEQLENELASKLVYLKSGLIAFKMQHGNFIFPDNEIKQEMINDIKKWARLVKNRPKALESYNTLIQLINGNTVTIPKNCFNQTNFQSNEQSTLNWAEGMMRSTNQLENQNEEVRRDYENKGYHEVPFKKYRKNQRNNDEYR